MLNPPTSVKYCRVPSQVEELHRYFQIVARFRRLVDHVQLGLTSVSGGVVIPNHVERAQTFLRAKVSSTRFEVVIEQVSEK